MWQSNTSWKEGLFSEFPLEAFDIISTESLKFQGYVLAVFTPLNSYKMDDSERNDWDNLRLKSVLPDVLQVQVGSNCYIVAVDICARSTESWIDVKTKDNISCRAYFAINYQAVNVEALFRSDDPLFDLKVKAGNVIQQFVSQRDFSSLQEIEEVENSLRAIEVKNETGISVKQLFNLQVGSRTGVKVYESTVKLPVYQIDKEEKIKILKGLDINSPTLIAQVLYHNDSDFYKILKFIRKHEDPIERNIELLGWLQEKDQLMETDIQSVIDHLKVKAKTEEPERKFKVSVAFPLLLSKKFDSVFLFQLYLPEKRPTVNKNIRAQFQEQLKEEFTDQSKIEVGQKIQVEFYGSQFNFSKPVIKSANEAITKIVFLGSAKDTCQPGFHNIRVSVSDVETQREIESFNVQVRVVDFVFDHVSRPLLSKVSTAVLGIGSFAMFTLALLEQIDKAIGLTSGTAAGVLAAIILANFYNLYQRVRPHTI